MPFPSSQLASIALRSLSVDHELSPLVQRNLTLDSSVNAASNGENIAPGSLENLPNITISASPVLNKGSEAWAQTPSVLRIEYRATTNRMLRVVVNGFMESLALVLNVMEDLDKDVFQKAVYQFSSGV